MSIRSYHGGSYAASSPRPQSVVAWLGGRAGQAAMSVAAGLGGVFVALHRRYEQGKAIRRLSEMPDHMLKDIGLSRSDIVYAVRFGRPGYPEHTARTPGRDELRHRGSEYLGF